MTRFLLTAVIMSAALTSAAEGLHLNRGRGFPWQSPGTDPSVVSNATGDTLRFHLPADVGEDNFRLSFLVQNRHATPDKGYQYTDNQGEKHTALMPGWNLTLSGGSGDIFTLSFNLKATQRIDDSYDESLLATILTDGKSHEHPVAKPRSPHIFELSRTDGEWSLSADGYVLISDSAKGIEGISAVTICIPPGGEISLPSLSLTHSPNLSEAMGNKFLCLRDIHTEIGKSADPRAAYWGIVSHSLEENLLRPGGDYILALLPDGAGGYNIHYVSGAKVCPAIWTPGMLKATMTPDLTGGWRVTWRDGNGHYVPSPIKAIDDDADNITIHFPYLGGSSMTLRRLSNFSPATRLTDDSNP